jgi:formylglycine-generating enzyme required for sulfatase activity
MGIRVPRRDAAPFSTGDADHRLANYNWKQPYGNAPTRHVPRGAMTRRGFPSNSWGLADMHGNVGMDLGLVAYPDETSSARRGPSAASAWSRRSWQVGA